MKILRNEKGFALLFVLILAAIALVMTLGMLFMVGRGSFVSGQQKRYRTAVEASRGGVEAMLQLISYSGSGTPPFSNMLTDGTHASGNILTKLALPTTSWGTGVDNSITINPTVASTYDMQMALGNYIVYTKIVDTVDGNTGPDEGLIKTGVVNAGSGEVTVVSIPYLYTIEVLAQSNATNVTERSKFSVLYQY
jgi:hypothetical protein